MVQRALGIDREDQLQFFLAWRLYDLQVDQNTSFMTEREGYGARQAYSDSFNIQNKYKVCKKDRSWSQKRK